ncbi:unnamed protein product [Adineta steineri]|uniref:Cytochrome b5 heme-binding domain-containing protein n=3 Tax=Adineta steineri TaxID=433720 RepID=A0A814D0H1_9BILA|nr:unnamed protein product [Adineta steineri]CAF0949396.1 unnamed protein product [Adineta steineri]CAF3672198.1 unnamed protein product [Adineta steineri]
MAYTTDSIDYSDAAIPDILKSPHILASNIDRSLSSTRSKMSVIEEEEILMKTNYVARILKNEPELLPITKSNWYKEIHWSQAIFLCIEPFIALYGISTTSVVWQTVAFALFWYSLTGLGITAGYHRLLAHRSYEACLGLRYALVTLAAGAFQGSALWWAKRHRAHHRYTDTDLDPYNAHKSIFHAHIGWLLFKPRRNLPLIDITDLAHDESVQWQHKNFIALAMSMTFFVPTLVCGLGWNDYRGGFFFASVLRLVMLHHSTFCVNSLAHYLGDMPFDDKHTPRDHFITALITGGEGYHNFHHEFPSDYRNALKWFQYDPTKWVIWIAMKCGLASNLKKFPDNEIQKGRYTMTVKALNEVRDSIAWPKDRTQLPIISFEEYQQMSNGDDGRQFVLIAGFVHDVTDFIDSHPGGRALLKSQVGKDATVPFHGGVHAHNNAAHNLLAMMRVAICEQGGEVECLKKQL